MRKTLLLAVLSLILAVPSFAQRGRGNGSGHEQRGNQQREQRHEQRSIPPRHDDRGRGIMRDDHSWKGDQDRRFHEQEGWGHERRGYHWGAPNREIRDHWDGRRFDRDYWNEHWGEGHRFYWNHCRWYGPRWYPGSYFWYNGVYFVIVDEIPAPWYGDPVYVVYDEFCGCYYVVDPFYPGVRIHVDIRF